MSIGDDKALMMKAAEHLDDAAAKVNGANLDLQDGLGPLQQAFEGTGRQDLLELSGTVAMAQMDADELLVRILGTANAIRDAAAMM